MEIDEKYKINLQGQYNRSITWCMKCDHEFYRDQSHGTLFDNIIGFSDAYIGLVAIWECPVCFSKWFYHGDSHYNYFLDSIEMGTQKHFKE